MKLTTGMVVAATGLASLASAIPIRIVNIDAFVPASHSNIDVGTITHIPNQPVGAPSDLGKSLEALSTDWWREFVDKYSIGSVPDGVADAGSHLNRPHKWHSSHPHLGPHDHSMPSTDASLIPSWMYDTPLSSSRYAPVVARPGSPMDGVAMKGHGGVIKLVTGSDGVVMYQYIEGDAERRHGGIVCVYQSFKRMVQSLSPHELFVFTFATILMLLVILRLALLTALLIRRAHHYANERPEVDEYPGEAAARRREEVQEARKEDEETLPAYAVDSADVDEKDGLLPPYSERS